MDGHIDEWIVDRYSENNTIKYYSGIPKYGTWLEVMKYREKMWNKTNNRL